MIKIIIDDKEYEANINDTVLDVARRENVYIPTLCYLKNINKSSDCKMCIVKTDKSPNFISSCSLKVKENMKIYTNTQEVIDARKTILELIISNHHFDCENCNREGRCELKNIMKELNVFSSELNGEKNNYELDNKSPSIVKDLNKCISCKRCVSTCKDIQEVNALEIINRGFKSSASTAFNASLNDINCTFCGQCINNCPTGAISEKKAINDVIEAIKDKDKLVFVQTAPSIRVALGEEFGLPIGTNVTGQMVTALKEIGFDKVFDTNVGADFTIMEEASELVERIKNNEALPMITSCSPAWVRFIEMNYPEMVKHLSTCKSPHQMLGTLIKTYYAKKMNIDPKKIYMVSIMPCTSKKFEITREGNKYNNLLDVDAVITTRELAKIIRNNSIDFKSLNNTTFDNPLGQATGAGSIFGNTGGVMEAALRTAKDLLGEVNEKIEFNEVRGEEGIKKTTISINNKKYKIVVASGLANANKILLELKANPSQYDFIEIMACPGGCIMGGGQPIINSETRSKIDVQKLRAKAMYDIDNSSEIRKSHNNPILQKIYMEYLGKPGKTIAHEHLHTIHRQRDKYNI